MVLDCTLRDGGYVNSWNFGEKNIRKIITKLIESDIDIIECGFLTNKEKSYIGCSKFNSIEEINSFLPKNCNKNFAVMINYGQFDIENIPMYKGFGINCIRVAFHKKNLSNALDYCSKLKEKGYKVFVQAMVSLSYSDLEFEYMIQKCNSFSPYSVYVVDSFGMMKKNEVLHYFEMLDKQLLNNIVIGFHAHNNMQLAFSNAIELINYAKRDFIIDSSIHGMGRGAGNLNTEILIEYLNDNLQTQYQLRPILEANDQVIEKIYSIQKWGYSLPNYLSAKHSCHPEYANFLSSKNNLTIDDIDAIFNMLSEDKKTEYDKEYISDLYYSYLKSRENSSDDFQKIKKIFECKKVIMICPGKTSIKKYDELKKEIDDNTIIVSINFNYELENTNYIFVGNNKRMKELDPKLLDKVICTANIPNTNVLYKISYSALLNNINYVKDNSGLMFIKLMSMCDIKSLVIIGMDYYSYQQDDNYINNELAMITNKEQIDNMNKGISSFLEEYSSKLCIKHIK